MKWLRTIPLPWGKVIALILRGCDVRKLVLALRVMPPSYPPHFYLVRRLRQDAQTRSTLQSRRRYHESHDEHSHGLGDDDPDIV
jgi:hypothetical protein